MYMDYAITYDSWKIHLQNKNMFTYNRTYAAYLSIMTCGTSSSVLSASFL